MTRLVVRLLGGFRVELGGEPVYDFETDKARALLAYLVVEPDRPHRRETLASLLWPGRPDAVARKNFRQALFLVRQALLDFEPPFFLFAAPTDVQFNSASDTWLDVAELQKFACAPARRAELLPEALCADFLAGFSVPDSEPFQAWALARQEQYHQLALEILDEQYACFEGSGDYEKAVAAARLQLRLEPWLEEAHRRCMRGLALAGRPEEALHQYEACCRALKTELGVEPATSTVDLVAGIRAGRVAASKSGRPAPRPYLVRPLRPATCPGMAPVPFVAREDELGQLGSYLEAALAGETGVAFVSGDPGSGKTALLETFAAIAMAKHPDLLVAGVRCSPGGSLDPFAPLRKLAEMLFGDLGSDIAWRLAQREAADRLQAATGRTLAALMEHGQGLIESLVPAASIAHRAARGGPGEPSGGWAPGTRRYVRPVLLPQDTLTQGALFDQLVCTLAALARSQPLLLLFDDLQWVDDATAAFLLHLGRALDASRLLVLGAYRSTTVSLGRRDPRTGEVTRHPLVTAINELRRARDEIVVELDRADGRAFVEAFVDAGPNRLSTPFRDALYARTGGHALFTAETWRNLQGRGEIFKDEAGRWTARDSLDWGNLPARVEAIIAERIDRLPEREQRILAAASVQGDEFSGELVAALTGLPVHEVLAALSGSLAREHALVCAEGVQRASAVAAAGLPPQWVHSVYRFTHHLFQKYIYDELDPVERAQLHGDIATNLDQQIGDDAGERERLSARLAWHYEAGGLPLQAARALHDAGRQALRVSAFREALDHFDHGLALLANAPPSAERTAVGRQLQTARLGPQRDLSGLGSSDVKGALERAAGALAGDETGRTAFMVLLGQGTFLLAGGRHGESLAVYARLLDQATSCGDRAFMSVAHLGLGTVNSALGNLRESERHLEWVLSDLTDERAAEIRAAAAFDPGPVALVFSALNQWCLGYPDAAVARCKQALAGAITQGDTYGQVYGTAVGSLLLFFLQDEEALQDLSEQCYRLSLQQGFAWWRSFAEVFLGRRMVLAGEAAAGLERMQGGIAGWQDAGLAFGSATLGLVMADACLLAATRRAPGDGGTDTGAVRTVLLASGLAAIDAAIGPGKTWPSQIFPPELWRVRGELLLARDGLAASGAALECFEKAMGLASERGLLPLELRAAMSLVRLHERRRGLRSGTEREAHACEADLAQARACLAEVYARFTEGLALPDLREAAALIGNTGLVELNSPLGDPAVE